MPVKIVTDSTASLPAELAAQHDITVVPLRVRFGSDEYLGGVEISDEEFYRLLETSPEHPATSQPTPAQFQEVYERLGADGDPVVSIHLSELMSGTLASARQAAAQLPEQAIHIFDSRTISMGLGMLAIEAARAAARGESAERILDLVEDLSSRSYLVFVVATLEYLRRGGRIGGAQAFLGSLLKVKPVLHVHDGQVDAVSRVRSFSKAYGAIRSYVQEHAPHGLEHAAIVHAVAEEQVQRLQEQVLAELPVSGDAYIGLSLDPVVGTHAGPGTFGLAFIARAGP